MKIQCTQNVPAKPTIERQSVRVFVGSQIEQGRASKAVHDQGDIPQPNREFRKMNDFKPTGTDICSSPRLVEPLGY